MVDRLQIENPANKHMHYETRTPVGVITPPDKLPSVVVYSPIEGEKRFKQMEQDLYVGQKNAKRLNTYKFPQVLKVLGGIILVAGTIIFRKDIGKFVKKLFRK